MGRTDAFLSCRKLVLAATPARMSSARGAAAASARGATAATAARRPRGAITGSRPRRTITRRRSGRTVSRRALPLMHYLRRNPHRFGPAVAGKVRSRRAIGPLAGAAGSGMPAARRLAKTSPPTAIRGLRRPRILLPRILTAGTRTALRMRCSGRLAKPTPAAPARSVLSRTSRRRRARPACAGLRSARGPVLRAGFTARLLRAAQSLRHRHVLHRAGLLMREEAARPARLWSESGRSVRVM
jgi:hypothetical protein